MAVKIINESLPVDSEKKYGKARLKQQEIEQKLNKDLEESKELNDTLKDKYEKSKDLLAKIFDMNITDKERDALRKELKELIK